MPPQYLNMQTQSIHTFSTHHVSPGKSGLGIIGGWAAQVERCQLILRGGEVVEMAASPDGSAVVVPTFTPAHFERVMNTRASASSVERRQRTMQVEVLLTKSLSPSADAVSIQYAVISTSN